MVRSASYNAEKIEVLEGLEPVRKRPGMYIGGTEGPSGLHQLVREILDNSIDEAMNGYATNVVVTLHKDGQSVTVVDDGRGIPVDKHPKFEKSALELIFTTLHAGGKFSDESYVSAGGLHGVGASVVNALSEKLSATVSRDGYEWEMSFSRGKPTSKLKRGAKTRDHGTKVFFRPDTEIFSKIDFVSDRIDEMVREKAFLNKGLRIVFKDETRQTEKSYHYEEGIKAYLESLLEKEEQAAVAEEIFSFERANGIKVEVCFCWTESTNEKILSFVNGIATKEGGSHEDGFKTGLTRAIRNYLSVHSVNTKGLKVAAEDIREGLLAIVSVNVPGAVTQLQFQGQTKDKLNNPEIAAPVEALSRSFENILNSKPTSATQLMDRILLAAKARAAARSASQAVSRKIGVSHRLNLPGKLADCSSTSPEKSELFIVEGDSAGGSTKQGRDRNTQAVFPLRGKILNSFAASAAQVMENKELQDLVSALGCGCGDKINLDRLRYGRVIILTDADSDGMHIGSLLMAFFFRFMRPLMEAGHVYLGLSPLYRIKLGSGEKEEFYWVYSDEEKDQVLKTKASRRKVHVTRFKGLGEMNPKALWETTLSPRSRNLLRIQIDESSDPETVLESLLGKDSSDRYKLIQENAHRLELDL